MLVVVEVAENSYGSLQHYTVDRMLAEHGKPAGNCTVL